MSFVIPLQPVPNQELTVTLEGNSYSIKLQALRNTMAVTLAINGVTILSGLRVVTGTPLIPYSYLENGNFIFIADNTDIPFYPDFGVTQTLLYFTNAELRALRG